MPAGLSGVVASLILAISQGHPDAALLLLERGANPDLQDEDGTSALMEAVVTDHAELIQILLTYRANPALTNRDGRTATDLAEQRGNQEAAALLAQRPSPSPAC